MSFSKFFYLLIISVLNFYNTLFLHTPQHIRLKILISTSHILTQYHVGKLTDVFEGSIVRVIRRLEELLRQLATAATAIGNNELKKLFEDGATKIRRGVVFAASLYL